MELRQVLITSTLSHAHTEAPIPATNQKEEAIHCILIIQME